MAKVATHTKSGDKWVRSACKMCLHGCGIKVRVKDGVILKIEGDPDNANNMGKLCPKGQSGIMRHYDPNRIKTPVRRTNPQKGPGVDPKWEPISWNEALDIVGKRLKKIRSEDPRKLLVAINDFQRIHLWGWGAAFGTGHYFNTVGQFCGAAYHPFCGFFDGSFACANDYKYCNYWIQIGGGDGFGAHLHLSGSIKRMADARVNRGLKLIGVDPRMASYCAKADEWVPIIPGTDRAFILGMVYVILYELDRYDAEFIKKYTNGPYLIKPDGRYFRDKETQKPMVWDSVDNRAKVYDDPTIKDFTLEGYFKIDGIKVRPGFQVIKDTLKDHTPERMSKICDVSPGTMRRIAREFVEEARIGSTIMIEGKEYPYRPAAINFYRGAIGHYDGTLDHAAIKLMNSLVGNIDVPGGHLGVGLDHRLLIVEPGEDGMLKPQPHILHPGVPFAYPPQTLQMIEYFPMGLDPGHLVCHNILHPEEWGFDFKPEAALIFHSNPLKNINGYPKVLEVFKQLEFIVAIDILANESTEWADIILPDHDYLESTMLTLCEPPEVTGHTLRKPVVEPLYDSRDGHDILTDISERCGCLNELNGLLNFTMFIKPEYALKPGRKYSHLECIDRMAKSIYGEHMGLKWFQENNNAVRPQKPEECYLPWKGNRISFYHEYFLQVAEELQEQFRAVGREWDTSSYLAVPVWREEHPLHKIPGEYDLYAINFKAEAMLNHCENTTIPWIKELVSNIPIHKGVLINTKTAQAKGIKTGDRISIESPFGKVEGLARVIEEIHPRVIGISNAITRWTIHPVERKMNVNFNHLLPGNLEFTDLASGHQETATKVRISKI
ncbi:molybdopterin-dependent oxidoreductase [Desulfoscipio gibsoniae]|uniref:Anaerobic dehydrogenase, typically selenocysteine-containing n=1 Tax=Desulfoscipio gibsoniae DSM 7213 TaxID=767817 RepID=R4KLX7_9FIRM|nr:molybdopterin-dependent oxidoreductase [Desulfoscipio gibsoniae]AGL00646.1 anaerobic dehydrogenase, typically selenocysteine-containing [Desulfoscipio gibsoniae DSM 7213]